MRRDGASPGLTAALVFILAIIVTGASYLLVSTPGQTSTTSMSVTSSSTTFATSSTSGVTSSSQSFSATSSATSSYTTLGSSTSAPQISHIIIILMENKEYDGVFGNATAPYENAIASRYAVAANDLAVAHPSLPDYLAIVAGNTFGVNSDCLPAECSLPGNVTTIATLLDSHHLSWDEFAESMPANCSQVDSSDGLYFTKHSPFVYFGSITGNNGTGATSAYCDSHVVSLDQFYTDLQAGDLPNYSFVTPNICDDAHSCSLAVGDQWLSTFVPKIINSSSFASTAIFITYDEGNTNDTAGGGGRVPLILVSPFAKSGYVSQVQYSHYSLLATVESIFDLGNLGRNDTTAVPMGDLFAYGYP